ncbi:unnamed protein product [Prorocentrum cordatum]|uniref:Uncharacterized protein n=1 Tax=Prorocentrum cordatum TaxID=2364126 RepID=A0ABN9TL55_9DINO|nr:unnamed protein product [Polarella glacialis]
MTGTARGHCTTGPPRCWVIRPKPWTSSCGRKLQGPYESSMDSSRIGKMDGGGGGGGGRGEVSSSLMLLQVSSWGCGVSPPAGQGDRAKILPHLETRLPPTPSDAPRTCGLHGEFRAASLQDAPAGRVEPILPPVPAAG